MNASIQANQSTPAPAQQAVRTGVVQSIYVEGVHQMLLGYPNSRLLLHNLAHRNVADPDAPEVRQLACELVMPTGALIEMAQTILTSLATNKATLEKAKQESMGKYEVLVNGLPPVQPAASVIK